MTDLIYLGLIVGLIGALCLVMSRLGQLRKELEKQELAAKMERVYAIANYKREQSELLLNREQIMFSNHAVIGLCSYLENPVVGICEGYQPDPLNYNVLMPYVHDFVSGEKYYFRGALFLYSKENLDMLFKLSNHELQILINRYNHTNKCFKDTQIQKRTLNKYQLVEKLTANGFPFLDKSDELTPTP